MGDQWFTAEDLAALITPGVDDAFVAGDRGELAVAYIGDAPARDVWENVNRSRHAGIRFDPEAVICLGSSCTCDAADFAPDVEFTEADALMIGIELGYIGETDNLVVHGDSLMAHGITEGLEVAAWLSDRGLV